MEKFGKAQAMRRSEDVRFLTGHGRYVDDIAPEGALHGIMFRSPVAHAVIDALDVEAARQAPGVHLVVTVEDLLAAEVDITMTGVVMENRDGSKGAAPTRPWLAHKRVRHVGEPVALIVADSLQAAQDAAELIEFDYTELPAHLDICAGGEALHPEAPDNRAFDFGMGREAETAAAIDSAAKVVRLEVGDNRVIVNAMEPRGAYAEWDGSRLHVAFNGQGVWGLKGDMARVFGLDEANVRVTNPDVGGGFGMKAAPYPEYFAIAFAAMKLGQPVRWMSDRTEAMLSDHAGRDLVTMAELAFDAENRITAYRVHTLCNLGAYNSNFGQAIQSILFAKVLTGTYDIQNAWMRCEGFYTNTTQVDAYRGAGRPEAIYVLERMMDRAARELGVDPQELRRINFIKEFPYKTVTGENYDVGDFSRVLGHAEADADIAGFAARRAASEAQGKLRGLGLCYYIESILGDPSEDVRVEFTPEGGALIYVGTQSNGQGHETVYAKFLSDQTGIPFEAIEVVQGDSDLIARGGGTGGSRSIPLGLPSVKVASTDLAEKLKAIAADHLEVAPADLELVDGSVRIVGTDRAMSLADIARATDDKSLLSAAGRVEQDKPTFPNGTHVCELEVDPETGHVHILRYTIVDDFGVTVNPILLAGQVFGGVVQGIGQALHERTVFDADGQLLTATLLDYAVPRADDVPFFHFETRNIPTTANALGIKGAGEAGTIGAASAVMNAVVDALERAMGVTHVDMPATPAKLWAIIDEARAGGA